MRRAFPLLAPVALLLAGCAAPAADLEPATAPDPAGLVFSAPVAMAQPTGGAEPNLAILPDGTMFITAVAGSQERPNHAEGAAWLWRSTDGGASWETLRAPLRETPLGEAPMTRKPFGSSDADVVASPDGWTYYSDWWNWGLPVTGLPAPRYGSYMVERSPDGGKTWESVSVTTLDSLGGIDRQWLVAGPDGFVGLFYAYFHGANPTRGADGLPDGRSSIQAVYSRDHGKTWSAPRPVVVNEPGTFSQIAHPRLTADGLLWMPHGWTDEDERYWTDPSEVRVALSRDLGRTWTHAKVADVPEGFDNLWAVQGDHDDAGNLYVAWAARTGETMTVFLSESADGGGTWSKPIALTQDGLRFLPWVAAHGDGEVAVGWYGSNATGDPTEAPEGTAWFPYVAHRASAHAPFWVQSVSAEPVKAGPMCPKGAACRGERELLDYFSLDFDAEGRLHVAFAASREAGGAKAGHVHHAVAELTVTGVTAGG